MANHYYKIGKALLEQDKIQVIETLDKFSFADNSLDGSSIQEAWFPQIKADIYISHSHDDEDLAIKMAGWLEAEFNLKAFIDSCIWGYSDKLLWALDKKVAYNEEKKMFIYETRNYTTSHIHMMLSTALSTMIDKSECLFFLNTPNSVKPIDAIKKTESPWIYSEIAISNILRITPPSRFGRMAEHLEKGGCRLPIFSTIVE